MTFELNKLRYSSRAKINETHKIHVIFLGHNLNKYNFYITWHQSLNPFLDSS